VVKALHLFLSIRRTWELQLFDKLIKFEIFNDTVVLRPSCIILLQTLMVNVDPDAGVEENEQNYQKALTNFCAYLEVNNAIAALPFQSILREPLGAFWFHTFHCRITTTVAEKPKKI